MKISELVAIRPALENIAKKETDAVTALAVAKMVRKVLEAIQKFEVVRAELFAKFGEQQEDGTVQIKKENEEKFQIEIKKGLNKNVKIMPLDTAKLGLKIAPSDLLNCLKLFK